MFSLCKQLAAVFYELNHTEIVGYKNESVLLSNEVKLMENKQKFDTTNVLFRSSDSKSYMLTDEIDSNLNTNNTLKSNNDQILNIPEYEIHRVELLSDIFKQGEVHVTISGQANSLLLKKICRKISKTFPEFSNIIICIYSDSADGINLAKGDFISLSNQKDDPWLALYTYNPVEGEFFNDNPNVKLRVY